MLIPFNIFKVAQAAVVLLKTEPTHRMGRLRLVGLLYIADRELVKERGRPVTGDTPIATEFGPALARTLDLLQGADVELPAWQKFVRPDGPRDVVPGADPGLDLLSRREIATLQKLAGRFEHDEDYQIAAYTRGFAEWVTNRPPDGSTKKIPFDEFLEATGMRPKKAALLDIERAERAAEAVFGSAGLSNQPVSLVPEEARRRKTPTSRRKIVRSRATKKPA